ncbi:isoleucine--tRNA ligase [Buchnera aphidicola (Neophyllaphis podocarpi)]|uniref:isoleucine--tRNA ligase n=1 Tax=Buchnera aphidicola TaxID=9 RepID=UPI0031B893F3
MEKNYKNTLNLPKTEFSMKAQLIKKEKLILKQWKKENLYEKIRNIKKGKKKFFLQDGPPYANGRIHIGHAVNKILKDIIIKSKGMSGFDAPFIPCWDCHGLPVEHKVEKKIKQNNSKISRIEFIKECRNYAKEQVKYQKKEFMRLGILANWNKSYLTMDFKIEANIIRSLAKIIKNGHLQKGYRPVNWCVECNSSLAEAEVEYFDKKSYAIDVLFKIKNNKTIKKIINKKNIEKNIYIIVWTTTPWTLPASQAVALNPQLNYVLIKHEDKILIIAEDLLNKTTKRININNWKIIDSIKGSNLEHIILLHPFIKREIPVILGNHVNINSGSGAVHTAPDHGLEDYIISKKYKIKPINIVDNKGNYTNKINCLLNKVNVLKADKIIIQLINEKKKLLSNNKIIHSYPHCWRHKIPTIFRSTTQWFISMEQKKLRKKSLQGIKNVKWMPLWGKERMEFMINNRPDWCISRQRTWGVPMPLFIHKDTGILHPETIKIMEIVANYVEKEGISAWWNIDIKKLLGKKYKNYIKIKDVLDVWFDSGSINYLTKKNNNEYISDIYIEGLDQYRGWFMSSLMISTAIYNNPPYKKVIGHGFVVDKKGRKMSKSEGNTISPEDIISNSGADILRLWVASNNYTTEMTISNEIIKRIEDNYRRIRNTSRFIIANLYDFNPDKDIILPDNMVKFDKWIIDKTYYVQKKIIKSYSEYNFNKVVKYIIKFCSIDMGSIYLDIIKDRQYTLKKNSIGRKSCQTTLYYIIQSLVRWIAPILSFTAEEIWKFIPGKNKNYMLAEEWFKDLFKLNKQEVFNNQYWDKLMSVRKEVNKVIEKAKLTKVIKNSLESEIILYADKNTQKILNKIKTEIKFLLLTSDVKIEKYSTKNKEKNKNINEFKVVLSKINGYKCNRCWHYITKKNKNQDYINICNRCMDNIKGKGENRQFV